MASEELKAKEIPLNGRLNTELDPTQLSPADYTVLSNMRYTVTGIKPVMGQTKINTTVTSATYDNIVTGFHFKKDFPAETHNLIQVSNDSATDIYDNTTAIPSQGNFSALSVSPGAATGMFSNMPDGSVSFCNGTVNKIWSGTEQRCAGFIVTNYSGGTAFKYDYTEQINNTINNSLNVATLKRNTADNKVYVYIRSTRPISGIKWYVSTANAAAATVAGYYWNGTAYTTVGAITDNTSSGGATLAQTGTMTFTDTQSVAKVNILYGSMSYTYRFDFSGFTGDTVKIYYCTLMSNWQTFTDIWDGVDRICGSCILSNEGKLNEHVLQVYEDSYVKDDDTTYVNLDPIDTTDFLYVGFVERVCGMIFNFIGDYENDNASVITVKYWNGTAWVALTVTDGTSLSGVAFGQNGIVSWSPLAENVEFQTEITKELPLYYYQISFSANVDVTHLYYVAGIPVQRTITGYNLATTWQDRPILVNKTDEAKNQILIGGYGSVCTFNGTDSYIGRVGNNESITMAMPFFTKGSNNIYDSLLITKANESWIAEGTDPSNYVLYRLSDVYGCIAPHTMKSCSVGVEIAPGINKNVIIMRASNAIVMFDSGTISPIIEDIKNLFNDTYAYRVDTSTVSTETAFFDDEFLEYHWIYTDVTGVKREKVYDLVKRKWFDISRTTSQRLNYGWPVVDTSGNKYIIGGGSTGYVWRLEYGQTFDGEDITHTITKPDMFLAGSTMYETELRNIQLLVVAKNSTTSEVSCTTYPNTLTTGTSLTSKSVDESTRRIKILKWAAKDGSALMHSISFSFATDNENFGFEPLHLGVFYKVTRYST